MKIAVRRKATVTRRKKGRQRSRGIWVGYGEGGRCEKFNCVTASLICREKGRRVTMTDGGD
jgi:hypothetical protein